MLFTLGLRGFSLLESRPLLMMQRRILVYLQRESDGNIPRKARFTQSVVDTFNGGHQNIHRAEVFLRHSNNNLILYDKNEVTDPESQKLPLVRPPLCPIHHLTPDVIDQLPAETIDRGVDSGCSIILETSDELILLIRRAQHLRTFPGIWIPPGGHIEENESVLEAGLREFSEETGLTIQPENCVNNELKILGLWESSYPPILGLGLPIRHHIVVYFHAKLREPFTASRLQSELRLDPEEVGASVWLDRNIIQAIVEIYEESTGEKKPSGNIPNIAETVTITVTSPDHQQSFSTMETKSFLTRAPVTAQDKDRVSTGTKFALAEWLKLSNISRT